MVSSQWEETIARHSGLKRAKQPEIAIYFLDRIPAEDIRRAVELVERGLQRRHGVLRYRLWRPAFAAVHRAQRARLTHQEYLVHAHSKDLPGDVLGGIAEQIGHDRRDLLRPHLLDFRHARLLRLGLGWDGPDHPAPGKGRNAVRTHVKAVHVERDRL